MMRTRTIILCDAVVDVIVRGRTCMIKIAPNEKLKGWCETTHLIHAPIGGKLRVPGKREIERMVREDRKAVRYTRRKS